MYKVLLVEDEDIIRKGLAYMIDWLSLGCVVIASVTNGIEGPAAIKEHKPDIVITDVRMPFVDGIMMLEESIADYQYEAIIISGYDEFEYAQKAISLGVNEYLLKPLNVEYLTNTVKKLVENIDEKRLLSTYAKTIESTKLKNLIEPSIFDTLKDSKQKHVNLIIEEIKTRYNEKLSLADLSQEYGLSSAYLHEKFTECTGYTFNDFLNRYRIMKSLELLSETDLKVYEISEAVGFKDYKYFSIVFKKYIGYSPTKFLDALGQV